MFERNKMINEFMNKTGCTKEQSKYLVSELSKLPKIKNIVINHLDEINLYDCCRVEVVRCFGYSDEMVNIAAFRVYDKKLGIEFEKMHLYHFMADRPEYMTYEII